ncbi:Actin-depolymerizing factor 2, isoform c [Aphelenchoides fujianensis]|nr:Actin-depolymerizing factor 2, isoform c [Aphelenchoides fujianensis]
MASGVKVDPGCKQAYDDLHGKHLHSYIIFRISDDLTTIVVEKKGDKKSPYSEFVSEIEKTCGSGQECRYAAVDVEVTVQRQGADGASKLNKVIFVQYCPDGAPVRKRMIYASSVKALKSTLGVESLMQVQASDPERSGREGHQIRPDVPPTPVNARPPPRRVLIPLLRIEFAGRLLLFRKPSESTRPLPFVRSLRTPPLAFSRLLFVRTPPSTPSRPPFVLRTAHFF